MNDDLVNNTSKILPIQHEKDSNDFFEWEHLKKGALLFNKVQLSKTRNKDCPFRFLQQPEKYGSPALSLIGFFFATNFYK